MIPLTQYFQALFDLADNIEVTDQAGRQLPLNSGGTRVVDLLKKLKATNNKVMVLGNGGSAAIAGHIHNDLSKAASIRALAFQDVPMLTAMANDHGYQVAYNHCLSQWAEAKDLLIAISSSGESENMLLAAQTAKKAGCTVVTFSGFKPANPLRQLGDINFFVPIADYGCVENLHGMLAHYLTDMVQDIQKDNI